MQQLSGFVPTNFITMSARERLATNTAVMAYQDTDVAARYADQR
jgi:hypothetical protein